MPPMVKKFWILVLLTAGLLPSLLFLMSLVSDREHSYDTTLAVDSSIHQVTIPNSRTLLAPLYVHILGYQRTGSSYIGGIFNRGIADSFFIYEPLGALYTAMYGTWENRPANILWDIKQRRHIPDDEIRVTQDAMQRIFECRMSTLPTAMMLDSTWGLFQHNMTFVPAYIRCLATRGVTLRNIGSPCHKHIAQICPYNFDTREKNLEACKRVLWNNGTWESNDVLWREYFPGKSSQFSRYFACIRSLNPIMEHCAKQYLDTPCGRCHIRALKTVRASADVDDSLIQIFPNFRLVHIFREPEAAVTSQKRWAWTSSVYSVDRASVYCTMLVRNYVLSTALSAERTLQILYDNFMGNVTKGENDLFRFLGFQSIPDESQKYLKQERKRYAKFFAGNVTQPHHHQANCKQAYEEINLFR